jgi:hypoxanthine phosphoribosyltransferase
MDPIPLYQNRFHLTTANSLCQTAKMDNESPLEYNGQGSKHKDQSLISCIEGWGIAMQSYDHKHEGELYISWEQFDVLCRTLAVMVGGYDPEVIVGIAKGGVLPATVIASLLRREFYPIRLSRRHNDEIVRETPELLLGPPPSIAGQRVLLVDDIVVSGITLDLARRTCLEQGAAEVRTASLFAHSFSQRPDYVALVSDALIITPWDREALTGDRFVPHPEYEEQRGKQ